MAKLSKYERIQKEIKELESLIPDSKKFGEKSNYIFAVKAANQKKGYDIGKKILNLRKQSVKLEKEMGTKYSKGAADLYIGDDISGGLPVNPDYQERFDPRSELSIAKRQYESDIADKMTQTQTKRAFAIQERRRKSNSSQTSSTTAENSVGPSETKKVEKTRGATGYEDHHPLSDPDYNPESSKRNRPPRMNPLERENRKRFGDAKIDALKIRHKEWKEARKAGTLDQWRKKYGVN